MADTTDDTGALGGTGRYGSTVVVGLTGGIGAGKSTVAAALGRRGALVIDADEVARAVVAPGGAAHDAVVGRFGTVDRSALAGLVFADAGARSDLNAIVHPAVAGAIRQRLAADAGSHRVVVLEVPLLVEAGWTADVVVVVDCREDLAVERLVSARRMSEADVRARMAAQTSRAARLAVADHVIVNGGSVDELEDAVAALWPKLSGAGPGPGLAVP